MQPGFKMSRTLRLTATAGSSTTSTAGPSAPRPSASLVIVNQQNQVLMVHRNPEARSFGGVHVFPGGNYDEKQDASLQITAIRETFEETGILLASPPLSDSSVISQSEWDQARQALHTGTLPFTEFLNKHGLEPDANSLLPFTQWTTPKNIPRRFCTQFYVAFLPASSLPGFSTGTKQACLPTSDGGQEVISARFVHPNDALDEFHKKQITLMPPQFYILYTLSTILSGNTNTKDQRHRVTQLSQGAFGHLSINPKRLLMNSEESEEQVILTFEGDQTRGGQPGRLHRALVKFEKGGAVAEIDLQRNFDIFIDVKPEFVSSKL